MGQPQPLQVLRRFLSQAAVPHALLFTGIEGVGKRTTALRFAMALNCDTQGQTGSAEVLDLPAGPCGQCAVCRQIADGVHPDILHVAPRKGILRIDQIRQLLATLTMKPFSARRRVVIVADAHALNPEAGNALLKMLEEPPADTILILTARQRSDLLPTIVSRCRHLRFAPLGADILAGLLVQTRSMAPQRAATIAEAAGGSYTKALALADAQWSEQRDWVVGAIGLDRPRGVGAGATTLALAYAADLSQAKALIEPRLEILKTWIRDLCIWPYEPRHIINKDRADVLGAARAGLDDRRLLALWETVEKAHKDIVANGHLRLTLDVMALRMADLLTA